MLLSGSAHSSAVYQCFPLLDILIWESFALVVREVIVCVSVCAAEIKAQEYCILQYWG